MSTAAYRDASIGGCVDATCDTRPDGSLVLRSTEALGWFPDRLTDCLEQWATEAPDRTLVARRGPDGQWIRISYAQMLARVQAVGQSLVDAGLLSIEQMRNHPKRSELRSALGIAGDVLEVSNGDGSEAVRAGDVFMLCTDGLWEYLDDDVLERSLATAATPRAWLDQLDVEVKAAASHKTSHDNFTVLVVWTGAA